MDDENRTPLNDDERARLERYEAAERERQERERAEREKREREAREEAEKKRAERQRLAQAARPAAGKLWALFWLIIPSIIFFFVGRNSDRLSDICDAVMGFIRSGILISMVKIDDRYAKAGWLNMAGATLTAFANLRLQTGSTILFVFVLAMALIPGLLAVYLEYEAHSSLMTPYDYALADRWQSLWRWTAGAIAAALLGTVFSALAMGLFIVLAAALVSVGVSIAVFVTLYKSAKTLQDFV